MVLGRAGMRLEAQKFALYLLVPITASVAFNEPTVQKWSADYFQFIKYPSDPQTNLKEEFDAMKKRREEDIEWERKMADKRASGREEYLNQLKQLSAARGGGGSSDVENDTDSTKGRGWFGWWRRGNAGDETAPASR